MTSTFVRISVNGERVERPCEPRTHLGDFLRKELGLTGTHLSCEHGVCGACTVLVDGAPQRSCITFAVACEDSEVTTIEGYGDDPVMAALRRAFHEHHALQCGYCTPGMLCTARDIVLRLAGPDPQRVRYELAGNLCRCTGYVGIVEAIVSVLAAKARGELAMPSGGPTPLPAAGLGHGAGQAAVGPPGRLAAAIGGAAAGGAAAGGAAIGDAAAGGTTIAGTAIAGTAIAGTAIAGTAIAGTAAGAAAASAGAAARPPGAGVAPPAGTPGAGPAAGFDDWAPIVLPADGDWVEVLQTVRLSVPAGQVWERLQDLPLVAQCLPGARVLRHADDRAHGTIDVRFGPIGAAFAMRAELRRQAPERIGTMHAEGTDRLSGTRVKTRLRYTVLADGEAASRLELALSFLLEGPLAQFSRSGLVLDYVSELARRFGANLQAAADAPGGAAPDGTATAAGAGAPALPAAAPNLLSLLWARLRRWFGGR